MPKTPTAAAAPVVDVTPPLRHPCPRCSATCTCAKGTWVAHPDPDDPTGKRTVEVFECDHACMSRGVTA